MVKILLYNKKDGKLFYKYFDCEYDRDKYLRRLPYFKAIILINDFKNIYD